MDIRWLILWESSLFSLEWCNQYQNFSRELRYPSSRVNDWIITMTNLTRSAAHSLEQDQNLWENLKTAIAASSGFKRWQEEQVNNQQVLDERLDERVCSYLRETLEASAY
jgi:hypothetical protein